MANDKPSVTGIKRYTLNYNDKVSPHPEGELCLYSDVTVVVQQAYENGKKVGYREGHSDGERNAHAIRDYCPSGDYPGIGGG